ncbi:MAG: tricarboxylate transporter, partial [Pseudomonadota bacterium]
ACLGLIATMILKPETDIVFADRQAAGEDAEAPHGLWATMAWLLALLVLSGLLGFVLAAAIFTTVFLRFRAGLSWARAGLLMGCGVGFLILMARLLNRDFPPGLLQDLVDLPWPLT